MSAHVSPARVKYPVLTRVPCNSNPLESRGLSSSLPGPRSRVRVETATGGPRQRDSWAFAAADCPDRVYHVKGDDKARNPRSGGIRRPHTTCRSALRSRVRTDVVERTEQALCQIPDRITTVGTQHKALPGRGGGLYDVLNLNRAAQGALAAPPPPAPAPPLYPTTVRRSDRIFSVPNSMRS